MLAALHYRAATGRGQLIELAQMRERDEPARRRVRRRAARQGARRATGNRDPEQAPQGVYRVQRARSAGSRSPPATTPSGRRSRASSGATTSLADTRFATVAGRYEHHDELDARHQRVDRAART